MPLPTLVETARRGTGVALISALSCSNQDVDAATYGLIFVDADLAGRLLSLHEKGRASLLELSSGGLVSQWIAPSFGLNDYIFHALRYSEHLEAIAKGGHRERLAIISPAEAHLLLDAQKCAGAEEVIECFSVYLEETAVHFTARAKHGAHKFSTETIPLDMLRSVVAHGIVSTDVDQSMLQEMKGVFVDGYTPETASRVLASINAATGLNLVIVWDRYDDYGFGGDSEFGVRTKGCLFEIADGLKAMTDFLWGRECCPMRLDLAIGQEIQCRIERDGNYARECAAGASAPVGLTHTLPR